MKAQGSIVVNAPAEKIWPYLVEPEKVLLWSSTYKKYEYKGDQHSGVGTHLYLEEATGGPLVKADFEATVWEDCKGLVLHMVSGSGVKRYQQTYRLEPVDQGCRLTFEEVIELPWGVFGRIIGLLGEGGSKSTIKKIQLKLKSLVEA